MKFRLDPADQQFLEDLHRLGAATVNGLCESIGVTATAVRQRLTRLQSQELVARESVKTDRGRPHHIYRVTEKGLGQLGDNYRELAMILWREIKAIEDLPVLRSVLGGIRDAMTARLSTSVAGDSINDRFRELQSAMSDRGYSVEVDLEGELPILRETNCPYQELATLDPSICELEQQVFQQLLGTDVELTQCCLDGHTCCEFQPAGATDGETG
ncbi:MAG: transcriptional regulator [Planctomycetaceae bacterium]|nr:transcriptional regulator [Planctomycetaceae bacterium]